MQVVEAPNQYPEHADLFLAGGITGCPDWQSEIISKLSHHSKLVALNPRRSTKFTGDIAVEQIKWEYKALRSVDTVLFWFPSETLCPITLLELGVFTQRPQTRLIVGTHPDYARRLDVITQLELARPEVVVQSSLDGLVSEYEWSLLTR
ncbi:MAG: nucleoside 2-deoxyribosyltransferase domain-containing protein [Enterococcus sp.]|nr:nucleoside 2-deoxyribosyltransferase domain-containing protein [Enterococcus sp.]